MAQQNLLRRPGVPQQVGLTILYDLFIPFATHYVTYTKTGRKVPETQDALNGDVLPEDMGRLQPAR